MPIYTFKCQTEECSNIQEAFQKFEDEPPKCEKCGENTERVITPTKIRNKAPHAPLGKRIY